MSQRKSYTCVLTGLFASLLLIACAPQTESPPTPAAPQPGPINEGKAAFSAYCAACHGAEAQGTEVAGSLPGHSADIIRRQVRAPMGKMPSFPESQLTDAQLEAVIGYIASLPAPENHTEPLEMDDALIVHNWMTVFALKAGDAKDAQHHLDHIMEITTDHELKERAEEAQGLIAAGKLHNAEHEIEEMLAGKVEPEMGMPKLYLQLAFSALSARDNGDARHNMQHFVELASGADEVKGEELIKLIDMGDMHEAGHALEQMMEMTPHGE